MLVVERVWKRDADWESLFKCFQTSHNSQRRAPRQLQTSLGFRAFGGRCCGVSVAFWLKSWWHLRHRPGFFADAQRMAARSSAARTRPTTRTSSATSPLGSWWRRPCRWRRASPTSMDTGGDADNTTVVPDCRSCPTWWCEDKRSGGDAGLAPVPPPHRPESPMAPLRQSPTPEEPLASSTPALMPEPTSPTTIQIVHTLAESYVWVLFLMKMPSTVRKNDIFALLAVNNVVDGMQESPHAVGRLGKDWFVWMVSRLGAEQAQRRLPGSLICGKVLKKGDAIVQGFGPNERIIRLRCARRKSTCVTSSASMPQRDGAAIPG